MVASGSPSGAPTAEDHDQTPEADGAADSEPTRDAGAADDARTAELGDVTTAGAESDPAEVEPAAAPEEQGAEPLQEAISVPDADRLALESLATALFSLDDRLTESQHLLAHQSELAGKLHAENQRLRAGELRAALLPLVRDLLRVHDDIGRLAAGAERGDDLELIGVSLLEALARNGIAPISPAEGEPFDPKRHSAIEVVETDDAGRDRSIAGLVRAGFEWEDDRQTIRVADVSVYRYAAAASRPAAPGTTDAADESGGLVGPDTSGRAPAADEAPALPAASPRQGSDQLGASEAAGELS
jgi:molecular chaperone GrpE (heat shock protein)